MDTLPLTKSSRKSRVSSVRAPPLSIAAWMASGSEARPLAGLVAPMTWRSANPRWALLCSSSDTAAKVRFMGSANCR